MFTKLMRTLSFVLAAGIIVSTTGGCFGARKADGTALSAAARASSTGYAWDGQASGDVYRVNFGNALRAGLQALKQMKFALDSSATQRGVNDARLIARNEAGLLADLRFVKITDKQTEIKAKVGVTGDRSSSERILDEIAQVIAERKLDEE